MLKGRTAEHVMSVGRGIRRMTGGVWCQVSFASTARNAFPHAFRLRRRPRRRRRHRPCHSQQE